MYPGSRSSLFIVYFRRVHPGFFSPSFSRWHFSYLFFCCCSFWRRCKRSWRGWKKTLSFNIFAATASFFFAEPKTKNFFTKVAGSHDGSVDLSTGGGFFIFFCFFAATNKSKTSYGRLNGTEVGYLLLTQQPRARFSAFPRVFLLMLLHIIDGTP